MIGRPDRVQWSGEGRVGIGRRVQSLTRRLRPWRGCGTSTPVDRGRVELGRGGRLLGTMFRGRHLSGPRLDLVQPAALVVVWFLPDLAQLAVPTSTIPTSEAVNSSDAHARVAGRPLLMARRLGLTSVLLVPDRGRGCECARERSRLGMVSARIMTRLRGGLGRLSVLLVVLLAPGGRGRLSSRGGRARCRIAPLLRGRLRVC